MGNDSKNSQYFTNHHNWVVSQQWFDLRNTQRKISTDNDESPDREYVYCGFGYVLDMPVDVPLHRPISELHFGRYWLSSGWIIGACSDIGSRF